MRPAIPLNTHNVLDYVGGVALILCPAIFGFGAVDAARNLFLVLGFGLIVYSLLTNYRYSIAKLIPLGMHMALDVLAGAMLIAGPWLFGYRAAISGTTMAVHVVLGVGVWGLVAFTHPRSEAERRAMTRTTERVTPIDRRAA